MSISSRIEAIEQHLTDDYSVLTLAGADLTNVDKNILNLKQTWEERLLYFLANGTDTLWNNWEKVSGSGETITLNNTIEAKMEFIYKGNTSQTGTPTPDNPIPVQVVSGDNTIKVEGKNLFQTPNTQTLNGITLTKNTDGTFNLSGTATANTNMYLAVNLNDTKIQNGTYTISRKSTGYNTQIDFYNGNSWLATSIYVYGNNLKATSNITIPNNATMVRFIVYVSNGTTINLTNEYIQLEKSSTSTTYQPYQSQTYPINLGNIELCKIGDYQDKIAKSTGKNLFDKTSSTVNKYLNSSDGSLINSSTSSTSDYIDIKSSTTYIISGYGTSNYYKVVAYYNSSKTFISANTVTDAINTYSITTPNNAKYLRFHYTTANENQIMLNEGTTALPYEPYGKVWYLNKQIGKVVFKGGEDESWSLQSINSHGIANFQKAIAQYIGTTDNISLVNYFSPQTSPISGETQEGYRLNTSKTFYVRIKSNTASTVENFKTWLSTHNTTVYYVLATPTYTKITDELLTYQLEAIKKSYNTQTNISQTNNDMPFELDVVALGELEI